MNNSLKDLKIFKKSKKYNIIKHLNLLNFVYYRDEMD